jgi:hypothetical protein
MAKPPPVEYFNIHIQRVPKDQLGETMSALAKLGLTDVHPELITEIARFGQRAPPGDNLETLREWIVDHPTFKANQFADHLATLGRTKTSAYHALSKLVDEGGLKKVGVGQYVRKGAFLPGSKTKPAKAAKRKDIVHTEFILKFAGKRQGKIERLALLDAFRDDKRNPTAISASLKSLMRMGKIERVSEGIYAVLKNKANGSGAAHAP